MSNITYSKRSGTSGIRGQLYETKLISLINFRAKHNVNIEEYALATNMDNIGIFDDICLRFIVGTLDKPLAVFIQAKHRENDTILKNDWATYFDSYMKIKQAFKSTNTDLIFKGQYDEIECFFVIYTTARGDSNNETFESPYASSLNDVIGTAEGGQQTAAKNKDVEYLYKIIIKEQVTQLAKPIAKFFFDEVTDVQMFMNNEHVFSYHVILAQRFCEVSDIQLGKYRLARVRQEFFDTDDEILMTFKRSLYKEVVEKRRVENSEFETLVALFFDNPTDVTILSKVIGCVVRYKNGKLEFVNNKMINDDLTRQLRKIHVPEVLLDHAVEIAGREILSSKHIKVPAAFGNKDMIVRKDERITYLASKILHLIGKSDHNNVITLDESVDKGFLKLNGGIASAVGNLLVLDENSKMLKFNENIEELGDVAKRLLTTIKQNEIDNLNKYRIDVKIKMFPKLTFDCGDYDKKVAQDFFDRFLLYTNQADENGTGKILKKEIEIYQSFIVSKNSFLSHMIFLKYHDDIQDWWMSSNKALYLTEESKIFENAMNTVVSEPPMTAMNKMYEMKTEEANLTFICDVINSLEFIEQPRYIVSTENILLTLYKVKQYLQRKDHIVLDMNYSLKLPKSDYKTLIAELVTTNKDKIIIFVFKNFLDYELYYSEDKMEEIAKILKNMLTIIITDSEPLELVENMVLESFNIVYDDKTNLTDLTEDTQHSILQKKIRFQGQEIKLKSIVDEISKSFIKGEVLSKIVHNETIFLGEAAHMSNYDTWKNMYIGRRVCRNKKRDLPVMWIQTEDDTLIRLKHLQYATCTTQIKEKKSESFQSKLDQQQQESLHIDTLHDIDDDVVVLTTKPGMGKSTLFTHLFLQTKKVDQIMWIVRINLIEHCRNFFKWKKNETVIDILECIKFICLVILGQSYDDVTFVLQERNNELSIDYCTGDELLIFQLQMFLYFYNRKKVVFLFDGLDEIWPNYADEVLTLLKILKTYPKYIKHKIWITSRPYKNIKTILETEFDVSYDLENYSWIEQNMFLYMFWIKNEILLNNNETQLENIYDFINFMSQSPDINLFLKNNRPSDLNEKPYLSVYINFICYLKVELRSAPPRVMTALSALYDRCLAYITFINDFMTTPLNLYLIAHYFLNEIKGARKRLENWHFEINAFTFYTNFLNNKLKSISLKHSGGIRDFKARIFASSGISTEYDKLKSIKLKYYEIDIKKLEIPLDESTYLLYTIVFFYSSQQNYDIHKKLAAYTTFHINLFTYTDLKEIRLFLRLLKSENQKTGIICNVVNDIPIFIHDTIVEYLAAEFICDKVKKYNMNPEFILNVLDEKPSLKKMFEEHLKVNSELQAVIDDTKQLTQIIPTIIYPRGK